MKLSRVTLLWLVHYAATDARLDQTCSSSPTSRWSESRRSGKKDQASGGCSATSEFRASELLFLKAATIRPPDLHCGHAPCDRSTDRYESSSGCKYMSSDTTRRPDQRNLELATTVCWGSTGDKRTRRNSWKTFWKVRFLLL
ncbi:hypothetical protein TESG_01602 [Trichophyton tonsurans CBS 112818]|uniref:Secreted protein n=1 Tax=Trichophyton tonsurans (strain CBS 112818) TaxID=647933 RepID=F2RR96_TRIT1|nr:hypothetical protein TESG_01602 [Trichophyton tonsurans CBS 112818]